MTLLLKLLKKALAKKKLMHSKLALKRQVQKLKLNKDLIS